MAFVVTHEEKGGNGRALYPRSLTPFERDLLLWLLPEEKTGYRAYRGYVTSWVVVGEGRRGTGNFILAARGADPDNESPLPPVFAYGVVESGNTSIGVTLRELNGEQLEFEITNLAGEDLPEIIHERRRWNYSGWTPSMACPMCMNSPRLVAMHRRSGLAIVLALCPVDRRIWVHDERDGVNHLLPVTNFYNELMLQRGVRDPKIALDSGNLFNDLAGFSDADLAAAFAAYNSVRPKVDAADLAFPAPARPGFLKRMLSRIGL